MRLQRLDDRLAIADAPDADDLRRLHDAGFRSIVDLRADGEPRPRGLNPWEEASAAAAVGLAYRQIPVEPPYLGEHLLRAVERALRELPAPALIHCTSGRRAGVFAILVRAREAGQGVEECLRRGHDLGLDFDGMPRLTAFLRRSLERPSGRTPHPTAI